MCLKFLQQYCKSNFYSGIIKFPQRISIVMRVFYSLQHHSYFCLMKTFKPLLFLTSIMLFLAACEQPLIIKNLSGIYTGTAQVQERIEHNGVVVYEDTYSLEDQLIITEIDKKAYHYGIELVTAYDRGRLLYGEEMYTNDTYSLIEGYDSYGYTYTNKKDWRFKPQKDSVYFKLERYPYEPSFIQDPNDPNNGVWVFHTRTYILKAKR